jgi:predicted amidohydrolase
MRICVVQTRPIKGDIAANIVQHQRFIALAIAKRAGIVIFPELSITGYEPTLALELGASKDDPRFDVFQNLADTRKITIGIGAPTRHPAGIYISMVLFRPNTARETYSKQYLHSDEEPFFVSGQSSAGLIGGDNNVALSICYELSVPEHSAAAFRSGAKIYIASVAKTEDGIERACVTLAGIARKYSMTVLMSNSVGPCDNFVAAGRTSVWNDKGELLGQLNGVAEGFLVFDTQTVEVLKSEGFGSSSIGCESV